MGVKQDLLKEIENKVKRRKELQTRSVISKIESYAMEFMQEVENLREMAQFSTLDMYQDMVRMSVNSVHNMLKTVDSQCELEISWYDSEEEFPQVNGLLIKWSKEYQDKNDVEAELFIDMLSLIFK